MPSGLAPKRPNGTSPRSKQDQSRRGRLEAERLKGSVEKLGDKSLRKRKNYLDIFSATVPDPVDIGLADDAFP
jgi:hypothetical protein